MVAYWYPQFAVYDDITGWQIDPYLGNAEFYMDYADYDVNISLPQGWLVASTGELTNPNDVLSRQTRDRLAEARRSGNVVRVVREQDRGFGPTKATNTGFDGVGQVELPGAKRTRLRLGRLVEVSLGCDDRRRRGSRSRRPARHGGRSTPSIAHRRARGHGTGRPSSSEAPSSFCRGICGRTRGRR